MFPVGRLDVDTSGLLVLTNDGALTELLTHPRHGVEKAYVAEVDGTPSRGALAALRAGVDLDDGKTAPARCRVLSTDGSTDGGSALSRSSIHEGRKRHVRRMCAASAIPCGSGAHAHRSAPRHEACAGCVAAR